MRVSPVLLLIVGTVVIIVVAAGATFALGGGDDDDGGATAVAGTPTASGDVFGAPPNMTAHITSITPGHGEKIQQRATLPSGRGASGICAVVNYTDLPENNQWFRMAVDDAEVTQKLTLLLDGSESDPKGATMCYAPPGGVPVGVHSAAIIMQDPRNMSGTARELVAWKFEVIP